MGLKQLEDVKYFRLNNEINRPINGQIMLHKDKEALEAFFKENVEPNTKQFSSITEKIHFLIQENYLEKEFIHCHNDKYNKLSDLTDVLQKTENFLDNKLLDIENLLSIEKNLDNKEKNTKDINVER